MKNIFNNIFLKKNKGGSEILEDFNGYDISKNFFDFTFHNHSTHAFELLQNFKIGFK